MAPHPQLCKVTDRKVLGLDNLYKKYHITVLVYSYLFVSFAVFLCLQIRGEESMKCYRATVQTSLFAFVYDHLLILHIISMDLDYIFLFQVCLLRGSNWSGGM